jgi:hypothetical protein
MPPGPPPNPARPPLAPVDQADADYRFLPDPANRTDFWDVLKYVPLDRTGNSYLTFGFEARAEYEYFHNQMWGGGPQDTDGYYLGRLIPAVGLTLQPHVRLFAAFQYEKESGNPAGPRPGIDEDEGDFHEAFVDLSTGLDQPRSVTARLGQQELVYGTGRLVDNNEGVNVKSSFYGGRIILRRDDLRLDVFGTLPTELNTGTFDDRPNSRQTFWGAYGTGPLPLVDPGGQVDLYYLGIDTVNATYQQGSGREVRHSIGTRLFNRPAGAPLSPGFDYNVELVYQFGSFGSNGINAWTAASETGFTFSLPWSPRIGLRADIASGGRHPNGGALNTFNPLFPRGAYFGPKLSMFGQFNFFDVHPILMFSPLPSISCALDAAWFWRQSLVDGLYQIAGALLRRGTREVDAGLEPGRPAMSDLDGLVERPLRAPDAVNGARRPLRRDVAVQLHHGGARRYRLRAVDLDLEVRLRGGMRWWEDGGPEQQQVRQGAPRPGAPRAHRDLTRVLPHGR